MDDSRIVRSVSLTAREDDRRGRSDFQSSRDSNSSVFARLGPKVPMSADRQPNVPPYVPMAVGEPLLAGMIFGCTTETSHECLHRQLFGLPGSNKEKVLRVSPGAKLFLYNFQLKHMSGIFEAISHGGMHIVREAFGGNFPAQVKIRRIEDCPNLPVEDFSKAIKENFYEKRKFKYDLNSEQVGRLMSLFRARAGPWFSLPRVEIVQPDSSYRQRIVRIPLQHPDNIQKGTSSPNSASSSLRTSIDDCLNLAKRTSYSSPLASRIQSHQSQSPIAMGSPPLLSAKGDRMKNKKHSSTTSRSTSMQEELRHLPRVEQSKTAERAPQLKSKILRATGGEKEEKKVLHTPSTLRSLKDPKNRQETERRRASPTKKPKIVEKTLGSPLGKVQVSSSQPIDLQTIPSLLIPVKEASTQGSRSVTAVSANLQFPGKAGLVTGHSEATGSESCLKMERREKGENEEFIDVKEMVHIPIVDDGCFENLKRVSMCRQDVSTRSQDLEGTLKESNDEEERREAGEPKGESHHPSNKISTAACGGNFEQSNLSSDVQLGQPYRSCTPEGLDCVGDLEEERDLETYISLSVKRSETFAQAGPATTLENSHNKEEVVRSVLKKRQRTEEDHAGLPSDLKVHKTGCSLTLSHDPGSAGGERLEMKGRTDGEEICDIAEGQAHSACSGHSDVTQPSQTPDDVADSLWNSRERSHEVEVTNTKLCKALFDEGDIETSGTKVDLQKTEGYDFNQSKVEVELHISGVLCHPEGKVRDKERIMKTDLRMVTGDSGRSFDPEKQLDRQYRNSSARPMMKSVECRQREEDMLFCELGIPEGSTAYEKTRMGKGSNKDREEREFGSLNPMPALQPTSPLLCALGKSEGSSALECKRLEENLLGDTPREGLGHKQERLTTPSTENKLQTTNKNSESKLDKGSFDKSVGEEGGLQSTGNEVAYWFCNAEELLAQKGKKGAKEILLRIAANLKDQGIGQDDEARESEIVASVKESSQVMEFGPRATDNKFQSTDLGSLQELGDREGDEGETWMPNGNPKPHKRGIPQIQEKEGGCLLKSPQESSALECKSQPGGEDKLEVIDYSAHQSDWSKHHLIEKYFLGGRDKESCDTEKANEATVDLEVIPLQEAQDGAVETLDEVMRTSYTSSQVIPNCSRVHPGPEESTNEILEISLTSTESEEDEPEVKTPVASHSNRWVHSTKDITPWKLLQKPHQ